VRALCRWSILY